MSETDAFVKPVCPKCGRKNVRSRATVEPSVQYLCVLCGHEGPAEAFGMKKELAA